MGGVGVQVSIVLARAKGTIFLGNKEEGSSLGRFGWDDSSSLKMFIYESFASFLFLEVEGIYFGDLWDKELFKINGMIIHSMRGKMIMDFFRKYVFEVGAPFWDFLIRGFSSLSQLNGESNLIEVFAVQTHLRKVLTKRRIILR